jgi:hypothetical protein
MSKLKGTDFTFVVMGGGPTERMRSYTGKNVQVTGYVPDVEPYFQESLCFVAPLIYGSGVKVKNIEALYSGICVLTNTVGIEGIPAVDGKDFYYCEAAEDYVSKIRGLADGTLCKCDGRKAIEDHFSLERSYDTIVTCLNMLADNGLDS